MFDSFIKYQMSDKERAKIKREKVANYKINIGCIDCGYKENHFALEFDHIKNSGLPYTGKQRTVASLMYNSWKVILSEISKCDIVCANCHAIRTMSRKKLYKLST